MSEKDQTTWEDSEGRAHAAISDGQRPDAASLHNSAAKQPQRTAADERQPSSANNRRRTSSLLGHSLSKSDIARAVLFTEILGPPRAKNPWRGTRGRS
ncbi:MAG TPA: hypothetical protein VFV52_04745 [Bacilli bacterium]|nr:hypothetical protein [Bacilli bacterium]